MHDVHNRISRKKKNSNKRTERIGGKIRKIEGKSNTVKRLTVPTEFFPVEASDDTVCKSSDDFHGLFNKCLNIRRSERILNKYSKENSNVNKYAKGESSQSCMRTSSKSGSFKEDILGILNNPLNLISYKEKKSPEPPKYQRYTNKPEHSKSKRAIKKTNSIFEEINQLYARSNLNNNISNDAIKEVDSKRTFCHLLFKQHKIGLGVGPKDLLGYKSRIFSGISKVDSILWGKTKMEPSRTPIKTNNVRTGDANEEINWKYYSKAEWVLYTPPRQKIIVPKLDDTQLRPAVLCTTNHHSQLYEWKSNVKVNVTDIDATSDIIVDRKYMDRVATTNLDARSDADMNSSSSLNKTETNNAIHLLSQSVSQVCNNVFSFPKPKSIENDTFTNVFSRPPKKYSKELKGENQAKRKLEKSLDGDIFFSSQHNELRTSQENVDPLSSAEFDTKKKLFIQNNNKEFKINFPNTSQNFRFDFKSNSGVDQNANVFNFGAKRSGMM